MVPPNPKPRRVLLTVTFATLAIFGGLVAALTIRLRGELREEVLRREADSIHAVALLQLQLAEEQRDTLGFASGLEQAFEAVLVSSKLRGVFAVHVFDPMGKLHSALPLSPGENATPRWWSGVPAAPRARFLPQGSVEGALGLALDPGSEATREPLLDIIVPLHAANEEPIGVARYWSSGEAIAATFAQMDRRLAIQAGVAFVGGAALIALVLAWAFRRLADAHRRLVEQSADLARANQELDFAAKTGALGAISAHLIHGLKNPLAGLEGFVVETASGAPETQRGEACRTAMETTRRLRALVSEVTTVLRDESDGAADYPVPVGEVVQAARIRAESGAEQAGVELCARSETEAHLDARTANLAGLVLANLIANAIEAAPRGSAVMLEARAADERVEFLVRDAGAGLPEAVQAALFRPVRSTKRGGGGVGLAISHRLARHASGDLELVHSDAAGTVFRLSVPVLRCAVKGSSTSQA